VRLDHLLSKEHLTCGPSRGTVWEGHAAAERAVGGCSFAVELLDELMLAAPSMRLVLHTRKGARGTSVDGVVEWMCVGTLLGPETTPVWGCPLVRATTRRQTVEAEVSVGVSGNVVGFWLVFENCTVDASIFVARY
jgi:hypothetical protein